jgi:hypothetical protein
LLEPETVGEIMQRMFENANTPEEIAARVVWHDSRNNYRLQMLRREEMTSEVKQWR